MVVEAEEWGLKVKGPFKSSEVLKFLSMNKLDHFWTVTQHILFLFLFVPFCVPRFISLHYFNEFF